MIDYDHDYYQLCTPIRKHKLDWLKHKYEIDLTPPLNHQYVKRDGVIWKDVSNVNLKYDVNEADKPLLIIECYADVDGFFNSEWAEKQEFISKFTFKNDPLTDALEIYRDGELLDEVQKIEIYRGGLGRLTKIRLTVLADVNVKWNFDLITEEIEEEHENT